MDTEQRLDKSERRIKTLEDAIVWLTVLGDTHNEQLEKFLFGLDELRANQANMGEKLNALIDAQIHSEDRIERLEELESRSEEKLNALIDVQVRSEDRIKRLEELQIRGEEITQRLESKMSDLADYVSLVHQRIDRLEEAK